MSWPPPRSSSLPGQSSVLTDLLSHRDQVLGAAWSFHPPVATTLLGLPVAGFVRDGSPRGASPILSLVPNPM